jgi:hypothetical protein
VRAREADALEALRRYLAAHGADGPCGCRCCAAARGVLWRRRADGERLHSVGRRVAENGPLGTDHGTAGPVAIRLQSWSWTYSGEKPMVTS